MAHVTFQGTPMTLAGRQLAAGDQMPDFTAAGPGLAPFAFGSTEGTRVVLSVPSLDTPVCDLEVRTFNAEAAALPGVGLVVVSMDLPFAQQRWCGAAGIDGIAVVSDFKDHAFAEATGTLIAELGLLARAVFVVAPDGTLAHVQYVPETTDAPDYAAAMAAARGAVGA